ncbi:NACHT domain-containing protein [Streptomyces glaucescens]
MLPLRTLVRRPDGLPAPGAFLAAVRVPFHDTQPDGWADRVLRDGRGLLLVDGVDEIPERERERTRRWLRDLLDVYPGNRWLVTSRPSAVRADWLAADGFTELALSPMSDDDVAAFVTRWHTAARAGARDPEVLDGYERSLLDAVRTKPRPRPPRHQPADVRSDLRSPPRPARLPPARPQGAVRRRAVDAARPPGRGTRHDHPR